ncbi:hypothetical protein [Spiroplasma kunkelii]|nr:hypothetical protein [Spiroplasma kunkelii]
MTTNLSLPDSEIIDNLLLCAKFLEDIKKGKKIPAISLEWV